MRLRVLPFLVGLLTAPAAAAPSLLVLTIGLDEPARAQSGGVEHIAQVAAQETGRFQVLPSASVWEPKASADRDAAFARAQALIKAGEKSLVEDLDAEKALISAIDALKELQKADLSQQSAFDAMVQATLLKAAANAANKFVPQAKLDMERVIAISPRATFKDDLFPPELLKFADDKRRQATRATGELSVVSTPAGANVWVDGVWQGLTPVTLPGLTESKHVIVLSLPGYGLKVTEATPRQDLKVTLDPAERAGLLDQWSKRVAAAPEGPDRDAVAREAGTAAGAEQVLLVVAKKSTTGSRLELTALRLDPRDGHNFSYATGVVGTTDAAATRALLDKLVSADAPRNGKDPVTHFAGGSGNGRTIAGVSLLGAGAVAVGLGVFFGVSANAKAAEFKETRQVETQRSQNIASAGRTFSVLADVSFVVGAASAVAGTVVLLAGGSSAPEPVKAPPVLPEPDDKAKKKADEDWKKAEDAAAKKRAADDAATAKKKSLDDEAAAAKQKAEDDAAAGAAKKKADDDAAAKKAEEEKQKAEEAAAAAAAAKKKPMSKAEAAAEKKRAADEAKKLEADAAKKKVEDDAAAKRKAEEEKKRGEEEAARKKAEEEKARADEEAKKKKKAEEDDLRNY